MPTRVKPYAESAASYIPELATLEKVRVAAKGCKACWLWTHGTQTVFGEGPRQAGIMFVGEARASSRWPRAAGGDALDIPQ